MASTVEDIGHSDPIGQRTGAHLSSDVASMELHGDFADAQLASNLLVHKAGGHKGHHRIPDRYLYPSGYPHLKEAYRFAELVLPSYRSRRSRVENIDQLPMSVGQSIELGCRYGLSSLGADLTYCGHGCLWTRLSGRGVTRSSAGLRARCPKGHTGRRRSGHERYDS